ncbi:MULTISPECIES: hypothetical protein [unclassified Paludibacterium]|uniref:hypothetical protein n=1 Tax=unclassified Paludibacterium TaxID=2618429 RepID=UPI001C03D60B|nr:hypothetical protein [Paludibacterium sp. B53371]BEV71174.1 hypothetical protein THUN1379_06560 [Paludibacterium sp. THUN1379]
MNESSLLAAATIVASWKDPEDGINNIPVIARRVVDLAEQIERELNKRRTVKTPDPLPAE